MELKFQDLGFQYSLDSIMLFQKEGETPYWSDSLYYFYPELDRKYVASLSYEKRWEYIGEILQKVYREKQKEMAQKVCAYNAHWQKYKNQITEAFSEAFERELSGSYQNMTGNITLNPVAPRYLDTTSFDVFYLNSERGALGMALHEMVHFVWFDVWKEHFQDNREEYERPHLKWIFSEMVVESILRDSRLSSINPYFQRDYEANVNGSVYDYFYSMKIEGRPILETLEKLYRSRKILDYMEEGYAYCCRHEAEIRKHIREQEVNSKW